MNGSGISSALCGPLCRLLDYWKIPANMPSGFARILHLSLCYLSLWLIASSNRPRYSDIGDMGRRNGVWEEPVSCDSMLIFWLTHMSDASYTLLRKFHQLRTLT